MVSVPRVRPPLEHRPANIVPPAALSLDSVQFRASIVSAPNGRIAALQTDQVRFTARNIVKNQETTSPRSAADMTTKVGSRPLEGNESPVLPRVLLVDDNGPILLRVAEVLKTSCTIVGTAMDGRSGIDAAATLQPDVIVLDISMPGMNGFEVAGSLREVGSTAALIFFTVHQEQDVMAAAFAAGASGYVTKQRLFTDLEHAVRAAHAGHRFVSPLD
jgi:CheY-like chemotaxis protein